ncbi:hypothetical protein CVT25_011602 [Psilocybe cyanescens]|uniref:Uncharacterized protein n=1 Tax=Psilocybe cyanescens TaxID=93625 RepID=A0A409XK20_PSICY|nr:hypothetical protein CVT25_011602 [Psilocybe cyanescens]
MSTARATREGTSNASPAVDGGPATRYPHPPLSLMLPCCQCPLSLPRHPLLPSLPVPHMLSLLSLGPLVVAISLCCCHVSLRLHSCQLASSLPPPFALAMSPSISVAAGSPLLLLALSATTMLPATSIAVCSPHHYQLPPVIASSAVSVSAGSPSLLPAPFVAAMSSAASVTACSSPTVSVAACSSPAVSITASSPHCCHLPSPLPHHLLSL